MEYIKSLNDKTSILESLDWDEEKLEQLLDFINMQNECFVPTHPQKLLNEIEEFFGQSCKLVMEKIMKRELETISKTGAEYEN